MHIAIASDHAGIEQKEAMVNHLIQQGFQVEDLGPFSEDSVDYPDFASKVAQMVSDGTVDRGILFCGTGIGMAITADKFAGVRAAPIVSVEFAELARKHNDLNLLALSARFVEPKVNQDIADTFLSTPFEAGRHARRVEKINALDKE